MNEKEYPYKIQIGNKNYMITEDQLRVIELFANRIVDENIDTWFIINNLKFQVYPNIKI